MTVKDDVLGDFGEVYPGLSRPEVERLLTILDQGAGAEGKLPLTIASSLKPLLPAIAERLQSYNKADVDDYVRILRGGAVLLLQRWQPEGEPPSPDSITAAMRSVASDA